MTKLEIRAAFIIAFALVAVGASPRTAAAAPVAICALDGPVSATRLAAEKSLRFDPGEGWAPKVSARCRYACRCYYVNRTQRSCAQTVVLECAGRQCGKCVERAKARSRRICRARGAVKRCGCPFRRLGLKP